MRLKMEQNKRYEPEVSFDFSSLSFDWEKYADQCNREDGGHSVAIAEYLFNTVGIDRRNIATGGASDYEFVVHYPRPNLSSAYGQAQWMSILLILGIMDISKKKNVLAISGGLDRFRIKVFKSIHGANITFLNNKKLGLYEKFQEPIDDYDVVTMQDFEKHVNNKYELMLAWSQDMENPLNPVSMFIDRLEDDGILIIQNTSDSMFLYNNHTKATPIWGYHDALRKDGRCNVYHIPVFYGITVVTKRSS
jgi:hypothetical protein